MRTPSSTTVTVGTCVRAGLAFLLAAALSLVATFSLATPECLATPAPSPAALRPAPVVAVLLSPFLTFADLSPTATPSLWSLAEKGAVGSMNSITDDPGWPTVAGGALTISAGRWASAAPTGPADAASLPAMKSANDDSRARPVLGALGDALRSAGGRTEAVGSSDPGTGTAVVPLRPAELVATDSKGNIDGSDTDDALLVADAEAPFGVRADRPRLSAAITSALADIESHPDPGGLLVVDPGDLSRAHAAASQPGADPVALARGRAIAIASLDAAAGDLARKLPPDSLLLVVTSTTDKPSYEPPYFGPVIASGRGISGALTSSSTHRTGLVTSLDVAPTALGALGVPAPATMIGSPLSARSDSAPLAERIAALTRTGAAVGAVDKLRDRYFTPAFAWFAVLCVLLATLAAFRPWKRLRVTSGYLLLLALSAPPAAWIALLVARAPASPGAASGAFLIAWLITGAAALAVVRLVSAEAALACLAADTVLLVLLDQWIGGPLQSGLFSYSVRAGWRYYGIGNEGSALAIAAALAGAGLACDLARNTRWEPLLRRYSIPFVGAVVLVTAAAPFAGANAGVAIWGFVALAVGWLRINRVRFSARTVAWTAAIGMLLIGLLIVIDMLGGGATHIGRFFLGIAQGGSGAWELIRRKAFNNVRYVTQTPYTWVALALATSLAVTRFVRPRPLLVTLAEKPCYAGALTGVVVGSIVALLTEDSGVVMPALMLLAGGLPALYLMSAASGPDTTDRGDVEVAVARSGPSPTLAGEARDQVLQIA